jgi:hypothetical protein
MESLAIFVGLMLLTMLISLITVIWLSFVNKTWARIIVFILSGVISFLGIMLIVSSAGNNNSLMIGFISTLLGISAVINSFRVKKHSSKA